jgi:hypothetical protein
MSERRPEDIAWAAGLFEGEGCISVRNPKNAYPGYIVVLHMSDRDVVERLNSLFPARNGVIDCGPRKKGYKTQFRWSLTSKHLVAGFLAEVLPYLGERRAAKAADALVWARSPDLRGKCRYSITPKRASSFAKGWETRRKNAS